MKLKSKLTALVTGASSGMGKSIARRLIADGYLVYVAARGVDRMADLVAQGAIPLRMDISKDEDIVAAVQVIAERSGGVDILVNNAGFGLYGPVEEIPLDDARYQFEVNLFGTARLTQLLLPAIRARRSGTIVNITSMGGKIYTPLGAWYHATKHALEGWSDCLRLEVESSGIRVVVVEPGVIDTGFGDVALSGLVERFGEGPYGKLVRSVADSVTRTYGRGGATRPEVIAGVVGGAIRSKRPKTRYVAGRYAKSMIWVRKWLGDRAFDRLIRSQM
ncbi:oxidoreductase [Asticcacaulis sp. AND118]|uniref:oxidoreductase n=1 Tax=Asticcacaulis sp. AND118 TaxID=2840468 RepID=UPI001D0015BD|nr:oxidoreductase [Asticcacaulis sp. AND118]UDF03161.1 SDR family NAD(P)-dependent oxidoreductase [Asticcacaulis sp. AND118]